MRNATNIKTSSFTGCSSIEIDKLINSSYEGELSYIGKGNILTVTVHTDNGKEYFDIESKVLLNNYTFPTKTTLDTSGKIYYKLPEDDFFSTIATEEGSDEATLKKLISSQGSLSPIFVSSHYDYTVILPKGSTGPRIISTATPTDTKAKVNNKAATNINGNPTERTATATVTAENGKSVKKYRVTFNVKSSESSDCSLIGLATSTGEWNKEFLSEECDYVVELPHDTTVIPDISFIKSNEMSNVTIDDAVELNGNKKDRTSTITVTAEDNINSCDYTLEFQLQEEVPPGEKVKNIEIQGNKILHSGDTSQMTALVKPDIAENKDIYWSIENGGNLASINQDGLLTSKNDLEGTITIKATAQDGSATNDTYEISKLKPLNANYTDKFDGKTYTCVISASGGGGDYSYEVIRANKNYTLSGDTLTMTVKNKNDKVSFRIRVIEKHGKSVEISK